MNQESRLKISEFLIPRKNRWSIRMALIFAFILFDYFSTVVFCRAPYQEINLYARAFMENFGIVPGVTMFCLLANLGTYVSLTAVSNWWDWFKTKKGIIIEIFFDIYLSWFIAGYAFSAGSSWFWNMPDLTRMFYGMTLYWILAVLLFVVPWLTRVRMAQYEAKRRLRF